MFSNFSNLRKRLEEGLDAVEQLATAHPRSVSGDPQASTSSTKPSSERNRGEGRDASPAGRELQAAVKRGASTARTPGKSMTLEDRLKAKLAAADASSSGAAPSSSRLASSTPDQPTSDPVLEQQRDVSTPLDPTSIPLPFSPQLLPAAEIRPSTPPISSFQDPLSVTSSPLNPISSPPRQSAITTTLASLPSDTQIENSSILTSPDVDAPSVSAILEPLVVLDSRSHPLDPLPNDPVGEAEESDTDITTPLADVEHSELDAEKLRDRLKLVEQRFSDVSKSFKRLQAEKVASEKVLKEMTPLEGISDTEGLREHLRNLQLKTEMSSDEIKRLNFQVKQHDGRVEELRDTHRLETKSQSDQIEAMKKRLQEAEALITATSQTTSSIEAASSAKQSTIDLLKIELEKAKNLAKDEEDKRVKAISLLKTVRTKLVKAEKDKEDVLKEKEDMRLERDASRGEANAVRSDMDRVRTEKDRELSALRAQFDRDIGGIRERLEKEQSGRKAQFELDAITTKAAHTKELTARSVRISQLEGTIRSLTQEKDSLFHQIQIRQAELESSQAALEAANVQNSELQYHLREASDRIALLSEESYRVTPSPQLRSHNSDSNVNGFPSPSHEAPVEIARLLSEAEGRFESRLSDMRAKIRVMEKERNDSEEEWGRNLLERGKEVERWKKAVSDKEAEFKLKAAAWEESETRIGALERSVYDLKVEREELRQEADDIKREMEKVREAEASLREDKAEAMSRVALLERNIEEVKGRESQQRSTVKTLRDELRKVQSSAALLERQRNPGVGYWAANGSTPRLVRTDSDGANGSMSTPMSPKSPGLPPPELPPSPQPQSRLSTSSIPGSSNDEEVNLEYLRNVILQFLENDKMRPDLVRVLSIILRFTPQETRRLLAKV